LSLPPNAVLKSPSSHFSSPSPGKPIKFNGRKRRSFVGKEECLKRVAISPGKKLTNKR
jgi:hypothetical protein